jgi:CelD/BcsL family acetyltransferase involved in cellulose biosynthesis
MTAVQASAAATADRTLVRLDSLEPASAEWGELAVRGRNPFATPEFLSAWWRWFGAADRLHAYEVRTPGGGLVGLLPLYLWRARPLRVLRFIGHGAGDQLGPLAAPDARSTVAAALTEVLTEARAPLVVAEQLPREEGWNERLGGRQLAREGSPVLRFAGRSWDRYLQDQSANFRQQSRRLERRLRKDHDVKFSLASTPAELDSGLAALFALHRARWSSKETNFARREEFHREFAALAFERGWARLWTLELDGAPAAAWYGLRFADAECYYQMGRDPRWDRASVGLVLLIHTVREAVADGVNEYRFLRGGESYKYRFTGEDPGLESIAVAHGRAGAAAVTAVRAALAAREAARVRLRKRA